jgi:hypothetical protein
MEFSDFYEKTENMSEFVPTILGKNWEWSKKMNQAAA